MLYSNQEFFDDFLSIITRDDKERFVKFFHEYSDEMSMYVFEECASCKAKKCMIAMIEGEVGKPALELHNEQPVSDTTPLAMIAHYFPDPEVIALMLDRGSVSHVNTECTVGQGADSASPLTHLLKSLCVHPLIYPWIKGESLFKLVIMLCQWKMKPCLDSARMLAPLTDSVNDIAWTFIRAGNLVSLAALLLVSREKALVPFDSGLTIRQRIALEIDASKAEGEIGHEGAEYTSMLTDACKLLDIFERAGLNLSLYCSSMRKSVAPDKVLSDVAGILKKADFLLQPLDLDLRDCFRECAGLWDAKLLKLCDLPGPKSKLHPYQTLAHGSGGALYKIPFGESLLRLKFKSGSMLSFTSSASMPRLLSTATGRIDRGSSSTAWKHMAYAAMKLKKGMRW